MLTVLLRMAKAKRKKLQSFVCLDRQISLTGMLSFSVFLVSKRSGISHLTQNCTLSGRRANNPILDDMEGLPSVVAATGYVFKIWIDELLPLIWRRFTVPAGIDFVTLHDVVQIVMGWQNYHLYQFGVGDYAITPNAPGYGDRYPEELIDGYLRRSGTQLLYEYDFGDRWEHTLALEKQLSRKASAPRCNAGARACPPEDCGGPWLYDEFLGARKKRKGKVSPKWQDRIGSYGDADAFDRKKVNQELADYWQSTVEERK